MTAKRVIQTLSMMVCLCTAVLALTGCIKDDMDGCENRYTLTVKVSAEGQEPVPGDADVKDVLLFIFDKEHNFLYGMEAVVNKAVEINGKPLDDLYVVAWGNLEQGGQTWTQPKEGDHISTCFVELKASSKATSPMDPVGDLFLGHLSIEASDPGRDKVIPIYRQVGSLDVTVHNLKEFAGYNDDDYHVIVHETPSWIAFKDGTLSGAMACFNPDGLFMLSGNKQVYKSGTFNLLPATGIVIEIYHGEELVETVSKDSGGNTIHVLKGKTTHVEIDLSAELSVSIHIEDWGDNAGEKQF